MAAAWHISAELFRRFLDQRASRSERRAVVRHLITQCPRCLGLVGRIVAEGGYWFGKDVAAGLADGDRFAVAFEAAAFTGRESRRVAFEYLRGVGQWSALERLLPEERLPSIVRHREYQHWGLFRALLDAARRYSFTDPREAVDIAGLAPEIADLLDPAKVGGAPTAADLKARAWAILGNARRLASDLPGAREAMNAAWRLNEEGAGDPLDKAQILSFDASYARTLGDFETAEAILEQALSLYLAVGDPHLQGRTLLQMGDAIGRVNPDRGIAHIQHALELINPVREPRLELCAQHDLAWFLTDADRPQEALRVLDRARPLYKQFPDDWAQDRLRWLQGKIARAFEQHAEAIHIFRQVYDDFEAQGRHMDLLMLSIDLAEAHCAAGEIGTAGRLLADITPIMTSWQLHRNAMAAWLLFQKTLEERMGSRAALDALFSRIRLYYLRYWHVPQAEFSTE
jgi:tetratricopeptide (TPR) repeat protein